MARGFLSGVVWGGAFSGLVLGAWSLSSDLPPRGAISAPPGGQVDSTVLTTAEPGTDRPVDPPAPEQADPKDGSAPLIVHREDGTVAAPKPDLSQPGRRPVAETGIARPELPRGSLNPPSGPKAVGADTTPLDPPVVSGAPDLPGGSVVAPSGGAVTVGRDVPVRPGATAPLPGAPKPEAKPIIVTGPAQPPAPAVPQVDSALVTERGEVVSPDPQPAPDPQTPDPEVAEPVTPEPETRDPQTPDVRTADPVTPEAETPDPQTPDVRSADPVTPEVKTPDPQTPDVQTADPVTPEVETPEPQTPDVQTADPVTPEPETRDPQTPGVQTADPVTPDPAPGAPGTEGPQLVAVPPVPSPGPLFESVEPTPEPDVSTLPPAAPQIGRPAKSLIDRTPAPQADPEPEPEATQAPALVGALTPESPLVRFAMPSDAPDGVPRMAIVLVDDGSGPLGPDALKSFPFPVSFAIAPSHPDAAAAARGYRALGFEVLVLGDMPAGAEASDVEVTMSGILNAVPEAVAVLEAPDGSLQENRDVSAQVVSYLAGTGHGLVMQPKGLNTPQKLALKDGVPAVTVFRDFDADSPDSTVIRRTLDQAAFRARQEAQPEGGVVMMGRLRADTISALVLWGLQDRAGSIALVPVSTVLTEALAD